MDIDGNVPDEVFVRTGAAAAATMTNPQRTFSTISSAPWSRVPLFADIEP
jgi:hypothetical protein